MKLPRALLREQDGGDLFGTVEHSQTNDSGGDGIRFREQDAGNLTAVAAHSSSVDHGGDGVRADEAGAGVGSLTLKKFTGSTGGNVPPTP